MLVRFCRGPKHTPKSIKTQSFSEPRLELGPRLPASARGCGALLCLRPAQPKVHCEETPRRARQPDPGSNTGLPRAPGTPRQARQLQPAGSRQPEERAGKRRSPTPDARRTTPTVRSSQSSAASAPGPGRAAPTCPALNVAPQPCSQVLVLRRDAGLRLSQWLTPSPPPANPAEGPAPAQSRPALPASYWLTFPPPRSWNG